MVDRNGLRFTSYYTRLVQSIKILLTSRSRSPGWHAWTTPASVEARKLCALVRPAGLCHKRPAWS